MHSNSKQSAGRADKPGVAAKTKTEAGHSRKRWTTLWSWAGKRNRATAILREKTAVLHALENVLPLVVGGLFVHGVYAWTTLPPDAGPLLGSISLAAAAISGFVYRSAVRPGLVPPRYTNLLAASIAAIVLVNIAAYVCIGFDTNQVVFVALLLFGIGRVFRSLPWVVALHVITLVMWTYLARLIFATPVWEVLTSLIIAVAVISIRDARCRGQSFRQLEEEKDQQKTTDQDLHTREEYNQLAIRAANDGHWYWNLQTDEIHFSAAWAAMLGFDEKEISNEWGVRS